MARTERGWSGRIGWPPPPDPPRVVDGVQWNRDGDLTLIPLRRQANDRALKGDLENTCCDCGGKHLFTFEVFRDPGGNWYLGKRAYRLTPPKKRRRR